MPSLPVDFSSEPAQKAAAAFERASAALLEHFGACADEGKFHICLAGGAARDLILGSPELIRDLDMLVWLPNPESDKLLPEFLARCSWQGQELLKSAARTPSLVLHPDGTFAEVIKISAIDGVPLDFPADIILAPAFTGAQKIQAGLDAYCPEYLALISASPYVRELRPDPATDRLSSCAALTYLEMFDIGLCQAAIAAGPGGKLDHAAECTWLFLRDLRNGTITVDERNLRADPRSQAVQTAHILRLQNKFPGRPTLCLAPAERSRLFFDFVNRGALGLNGIENPSLACEPNPAVLASLAERGALDSLWIENSLAPAEARIAVENARRSLAKLKEDARGRQALRCFVESCELRAGSAPAAAFPRALPL